VSGFPAPPGRVLYDLPVRFERSAGVLLHPTCLPSPHGIGDLGPGARAYLEWLAAAGVGWWQVLPLHPPGPGWSPYSALSTLAGSPLLVSLEDLVADGLLEPGDLEGYPALPAGRVDYPAVLAAKEAALRRAWERMVRREPDGLVDEFAAFVREEADWLEDWTLYDALRREHRGAPWWRWPPALRDREPAALERWAEAHCLETGFSRFCQWLFFRQWRNLHEHARRLGIRILGDVPIFLAHDSAEVWAHRELFRLDREGIPVAVAGVPPDYFSATGQLWGNPLYDWERLAADGYRWWVARLEHALRLFDVVRLDHFRGFAACWEVPAGAASAAEGRWVPGPGRELFAALERALGGLPFVAEDLGTITPDVHELRRELGLPGMAILQFAFTPEQRSSYLPYNLERDLVVYTGTHDNNTTVGWWLEEASPGERELAMAYMATDGREIHWDLVRLALGTVCDLAVVPHQDLAGLGSDCRMNTPGKGEGNWAFRITDRMLDAGIRDRLGRLLWVYGRSGA